MAEGSVRPFEDDRPSVPRAPIGSLCSDVDVEELLGTEEADKESDRGNGNASIFSCSV